MNHPKHSQEPEEGQIPSESDSSEATPVSTPPAGGAQDGLNHDELLTLFAPPPAAQAKPKKKRGWFGRKKKSDEAEASVNGDTEETTGADSEITAATDTASEMPTATVPTVTGPVYTSIVGFGQVPAPTEELDPEALIHLRKLHRVLFQPDSSPLHILRGVDLKIMPGEHVAIVGRSGTGKTTLLNQLGMLDLPNAGEYHIRGIDALRLSEARRSELRGNNVGFVFQQFNLFEARTAVENVAVPLLYTSGKTFWQRNQIAAEMLERVGLGARLDSKPTKLSGGEQQRVAIARALVRKPSLILADEPTGALDLDTGKVVMDLLEEIARENNSALVVITHDHKVAERAETIYELYDGVLHPFERGSGGQS